MSLGATAETPIDLTAMEEDKPDEAPKEDKVDEKPDQALKEDKVDEKPDQAPKEDKVDEEPDKAPRMTFEDFGIVGDPIEWYNNNCDNFEEGEPSPLYELAGADSSDPEEARREAEDWLLQELHYHCPQCKKSYKVLQEEQRECTCTLGSVLYYGECDACYIPGDDDDGAF
eukprot:g6342.t1